CPIDRFEFEIEKGIPAAPWKGNSTANTPGAFHAFYRVKFKTKAGQPPFPANFTFNYLRFDGVININNFNSRINDSITMAISPALYTPFLSISPSGEIVWEVGSTNNCEPGGGGGGIPLPLPMGATSVTLFTICVEAVPGDLIKWNTFSAFAEQCMPSTNCQGPMFVSATGGNTNINFPPPSPGQPTKGLHFAYAYDNGLQIPYIRVGILPLQASRYAKVDALIHVVPEMATALLDLQPFAHPDGPELAKALSRKNQDGSFDIYFSFEDFPHPDSSTLNGTDTIFVAAILLNGIYNLSQGGMLHCSLTAGRWASGTLANNFQTYQLTANNTTVDIPGHEPCEKDLTVTGTSILTQDCEGVVRFTLSHNHTGPMSFNHLRLELLYSADATGSATPGVPISTLPDAANSDTFIQVAPNLWFYIYEKITPLNSPFQIVSGMYVDVPFSLFHSCVDFRVTAGEGDPTPGAGNGNSYCALEVIIGDPLCDPRVTGSVFLSNFDQAPMYKVSLKDFNSPYEEEINTFCEPEFSFCPDQSQAPFFLKVETKPGYENDYLCTSGGGTGVTTYDIVLIQKHLKSSPQFPTVYERFAADATLDNILGTADINAFRNLILGVWDPTDNDPNNDGPFGTTPNWRYFNENINIPIPQPINDPIALRTVPILTGLTDTSHVPITGNGNYGNFYAVKLGDINRNCNCDGFRPTSQREEGSAQFTLGKEEVRQKGKLIRIPVYWESSFKPIALQGGFRFDPSVLAFKSIETNPEIPVYSWHFGATKTDEGILKFAWDNDQDLQLLPAKMYLFTVEFEVQEGQELPEGALFWSSDQVLHCLAYSENGEEFRVGQVRQEQISSRYPAMALTVSPNPATDQATAYIYSEKASEATLILTDGRNKIHTRQTISLQAGDNTLSVQFPASVQPGVFYLMLESGNTRLQKKLVKL
ncbi:MAG TPA: hypothetical protein DCF33_01780, partial [Saprospirales bacterium]|nr:hypothetical protein [Saprospirales bacterium]